MNGKIVTICALGLLGLGITTVTRTQAPTVPPGVAEENWIPISDGVGIVVTDLRAGPSRRSLDPSDTSLRASGIVMARYRGRWVMFENISALPPRVQPLK